jgi:hypothetical protein
MNFFTETAVRRASATGVVRRMRGKSQAHLLTADDGCHYVVKFRHAHHGVRALINELLGALTLRRLGFACPPPALIETGVQFLVANPVGIQCEGMMYPPAPGWHFGSLYPGDPASTRVYDFVPDKLLSRVANLTEFHGMLVFDIWAGQVERRQAVFVRDVLHHQRIESGACCNPDEFIALMIDNEHLFGASLWQFADIPEAAQYFRPAVYSGVSDIADLHPWIAAIQNLSDDTIGEYVAQIPQEWYLGMEAALDSLVLEWLKRRDCLDRLIAQSVRRSSSRQRRISVLDCCHTDVFNIAPEAGWQLP